MKYPVIALFFILSISSHAQEELVSFQFYSEGKELSFSEVASQLSNSDVVLFGEYHDHAMIHWLQLKMAQELIKRRELIMGGEFFETDDQLLLDELSAGITPFKKFEAEAKLWPNYETDYAPLIRLAVDSQTTFIATNTPRRYASFVVKFGADTLKNLPKESRELLPPMPMPFSWDTPGYAEMKDMMSGGHGMGMDPDKMVQAQALKDYTMAYNIVENREKNELFFHINGDFHSADYGGIYWYLKELKPKLDVQTIKIEQAELPSDYQDSWTSGGDFILVVPSDFTKTH